MLTITQVQHEIIARWGRATLVMHKQNARRWGRKQFEAMGFVTAAALELVEDAVDIAHLTQGATT